MKEPKICLCRDTMIKLFKHLQKTKSGKTLWQLIAKRTANQFPMRKPRNFRRMLDDPFSNDPKMTIKDFNLIQKLKKTRRKKPIKSFLTLKSGKMIQLKPRKKPRTAKQKAATRKLVAFNKKRFR